MKLVKDSIDKNMWVIIQADGMDSVRLDKEELEELLKLIKEELK